MKKALLLFLAAFCITASYAQLNMELASQVEYGSDVNDIWGWVDPETDIEYALVGLRDGVSIVSLENPEEAVEVVRIPGQNSTWRDLKTWGHFAYVTTDQPGTTEGVTVIDLSLLPEEAPYYHWTPNLENLGLLETCHNIYIDEFGYGYLAGCNLNNGGMLILNVDTDTGEPEFVAPAPPVYAHDVYTVNNHMYSSELFVGQMAVYDVSNKENIQLLGTAPTPFDFTHNIWVNEEETVAFTTDERANAPVAAYDITDFSDIQELDQYRPVASLGSGVIPHNVHVWNNYLLISYYTDGAKVVDASRPSNLIEVGSFDTWFGADGGFFGAWGLYPFLPSRRVLVSDINAGLFVFEPTFVRACWLEGTVVDSLTQAPLSEVEVVIDSEQPNLGVTDIFGAFETGQALSGTFNVTFSKPGYREKTISVNLENGELTEVAVELVKLPTFGINAIVQNEEGELLDAAAVVVQNEAFTYEAQTNAAGETFLPEVVLGDYTFIAGKWGYLHATEAITVDAAGNYIITLETGYQDDFVFDLDWETDANDATSGFWVREEPIGTSFSGVVANPGEDVADDIGQLCFITGNGGGGGGTDDVDGGEVILRSPYMDLSTYEAPELSLSYWFFVGGGNGSAPNDTLTIAIEENGEEQVIEKISNALSAWASLQNIDLLPYLSSGDSVRLVVRTSDFAPDGHIVEAGIDQFLVLDAAVINSETSVAPASGRTKVFPNPYRDYFTLQYELPAGTARAEARVFDAQGRLLQQLAIDPAAQQTTLGNELPNGLYFLQLAADGRVVHQQKVIKQ